MPVYFVKIGTAARLDGNIKQAISDGFDHLVATIDPPILKHVTNPLTNERGYKGKDMPIVSYDLIDGADYVEITCAPKALGSGRWAALEIFSFPTLDDDREIRHGVRAQGRLAALPAGGDRRRHRRHVRPVRQDRQARDRCGRSARKTPSRSSPPWRSGCSRP